MTVKKATDSLSTSRTLLERVKDPNDSEAWKEFIEYYKQYIYNILRYIGIPEADAEDLAQDIIVRLWKKMPEFVYDKDRGKFRSWLGVIIRNDANKYFNAKNKKNSVISSQETTDSITNSEHNGVFDIDKVIDSEWNHYISNLAWQSVRKKFRENTQKVFQYHIEGKAAKEIGELMNMNEDSVFVTISRVRIHLRDAMKKYKNELL